MATILVIDDEAVVREPIAASLRACGHAVTCAGDAKTALTATKADVPDLILLDVRMPEQDGITLLRKLRARAATADVPVLLLTNETQKGVILEAARVGVQGYILKSAFSLKELIERVNRITRPTEKGRERTEEIRGAGKKAGGATDDDAKIGTENAPNAPRPVPSVGSSVSKKNGTAATTNGPTRQLLTREQCSERVKEAVGGKALGGIVAQVIAMTASPSGDMGEVGALIGRDPELSARVLQVAKSAAFAASSGKTIDTIADAVRQVGGSAIRDLAATMGIFDAMARPTANSYDPLRCWLHSLTVAHLSQHLATMCQPDRAGLAYLIGLCHDLGEILLHTHFEKEFTQVLDVQAQTGQPLPQLERAMLGVRRAELADMLLVHLGLPAALRSPIEAFHRKSHARAELSNPLSCILQMADLYANGMLLAADGNSAVTFLSIAECRKSVGQEHPPTLDEMQLRSNMTVLTGMLAGLAPHELKRLEPVFPKTEGKIWVARHPAVSKWDPFSAALRALSGGITVSDHLPTAQEFAGTTHLAVLSPTTGAKGFALGNIEAALGALPSGTRLIWAVSQYEGNGREGKGRLPIPLPATLEQLVELLKP